MDQPNGWSICFFSITAVCIYFFSNFVRCSKHRKDACMDC